MSAPKNPTWPQAAPAKSKGNRLTDVEIAELRKKSRKSSEWIKQQLAIDPELKHLGPPGGRPAEAAEDRLSEKLCEPEIFMSSVD